MQKLRTLLVTDNLLLLNISCWMVRNSRGLFYFNKTQAKCTPCLSSINKTQAKCTYSQYRRTVDNGRAIHYSYPFTYNYEKTIYVGIKF